MTPMELEALDFLDYENINLGELEGQNSSVEMSWKELRGYVLKDPYEIYQKLKHVKRSMFEHYDLGDCWKTEEQIQKFIQEKLEYEWDKYIEAFRRYTGFDDYVFDEMKENLK